MEVLLEQERGQPLELVESLMPPVVPQAHPGHDEKLEMPQGLDAP